MRLKNLLQTKQNLKLEELINRLENNNTKLQQRFRKFFLELNLVSSSSND